MRRIAFISGFAVVILLLGFTGTSIAGTMTYDFTNTTTATIDSSATFPSSWYTLYFPNSNNPGGIYTGTGGGTFEYDNYLNGSLGSVTGLTITMTGHSSASGANLDIWFDADSTHGTSGSPQASRIAYFPLPTYDGTFTVTMDIFNNSLTFTGISPATYTFTDPGLSAFNNINSFYMGYACHFVLDSTKVHVTVEPTGGGPTPVPEPTTLLLLGTGLGVIGLAAWRRRK